MGHLLLPTGASLEKCDVLSYVATPCYGTGFLYHDQGHVEMDQNVETFRNAPIKQYYPEHGISGLEKLPDLNMHWLAQGNRMESFRYAKSAPLYRGWISCPDTSEMSAAADAWMLPMHPSIEQGSHYSKCLDLVNHVMIRILPTKFDDNIRFSIASIATLLNKAIEEAYTHAGVTYRSVRFSSAMYWRQASVDRMVGAEWCRHAATVLPQVNGNLFSLFFYSELGQSQDPKCHASCNESDCAASEVLFDGQKGSTHRSVYHSCDEVSLASECYGSKLRILTVEEDFPIAAVKRGTEGSLSMKTVARKNLKSDIAIPHVWADGLGNKHVNSLRK